MTPEQYAAQQAVITAGLTTYIQRWSRLFTGQVLAPREWLNLLLLLFPEVQRRYAEAAALGRDFYDSQRELHHPNLPRNERFLSEIQFEWFVKSMQPARKAMSQADSPSGAVARMTLTAVREVEMAGRRQIIGAVKNEPETDIVQGWARVATGRETCAWCLMLISRGPEYLGTDNAGLHLDDITAIDLFREAGGDLEKFREETKEHIEEWHAGCDCLVVPVFDTSNWPGMAAQKEALQLWREASLEATRRIESGKARSNNKNKETLNALRRRLDRGEITIPSYAFAA